MADILQCSFCEMKFVSTYKLIPHIFLGHRKKILKRINKKEDVMFKCPTGCGVNVKANYTFAPGCKQDEAFIDWLSGALVSLEQHSNIHTKETKATRCEYCQIELGDTIYWRHLQIHMSGKIETPAASTTSPDKAPPPPPAAGPGSADLKPTTTEKTLEPMKKLPVQSKSSKRPPSPIVASQNRPPSPPGPPPDFSPPASPPLQTAKAPEELAASTIPFSSFFKKKSASPPDSKMKSIYTAKDDSSSVGSSSAASIGSSLASSTAISSTISSLSSLSSSSLSPSRRHLEMTSASSPSLSRSSSLLENMSSTTSFRSASTESSSLSSSSIKTDTPEAKDTLKVKEAETKKHKISLSDYAKFRKKQTSEERESVKTVVSKEPESKFVEPEQAKQGPSTPPQPEPDVQTIEVEKPTVDYETKDSVKKDRKLSFESERKLPLPVEAERKLSVEFSEELPKARKISGDYSRFDPRRISTELSPRGDIKLITPKPVDAMRPPTPLDQPTTPTPLSQPNTPLALQSTTPTPPATTGQPTTPLGAPPSSEGSSRSTTPGLSRPTTPHDRSRRTSSDQRSRRPSDNSVPLKEKPKPVLTEEMERQIIFGGALLKGTKLKPTTDQPKSEKESSKETTKSTETTPKTTPTQKVSPKTTPTEKESPDTATKADKSSRDSSVSPQEEIETFEERQKREREERERKRKAELTREQKLAQVRKEIEMRFQEEELKRKKSRESQIKHEADLREKIRIEEEKLKKEKEKITSEKKRAKEEKRKAKKAKRKRKYSEDERHDRRSSELSDESESKRERKSEERLRRSQEQDVELLEQEIIEQQQQEYQQQQQKLVVLPPPVPAAAVREKSPDQYEKLKLNFLAKQKEALEKELKLLETQVGEQQQNIGDKQKSEEVEASENVEAVEDMEVEDEEDDLEAMMRSYMEKEQQKGTEEDSVEGAAGQVEAVSSLSLLLSNYEDIDDNNTTQEDEAMDEPIVVPDEEPEPQQVDEAAAATIESDNIEVDTTEAITKEEEEISVIQIPDDTPDPVMQEMDEETLAAAKSAAKDIMAPYKRSKRMKAASQLHCSLCKEEEGSSTSYISAYQLLSHVYLVHRKKILARSRKARGMTLSCPEGCGYITNMSKEGTSIDYFGDELPKHLDMLCEHIRDCHTGEPEMDTCQYCSLPLQHSQNWSWQHLANHRNIQRFYCDGCNNFPFKNEVHKCPGSGLETYQATSSDNLDSDTNMRRKRNMSEDDILGKSQDDLEREAEAANSNQSRQIKDLGNLVRFMCGVCDRVVTSLSAWLLHIRLDHLGRSHINYSHDIRCFCCPWMPPRFEKGREIIGVNNLVQHIITEHHSEDWRDVEFTVESSKLVQLQREMERRLEREREELAIQIPKLPAPCKTCNMQLGQAKLWRYHALAHRFGEVFCSTCHTFILGHHFMEHSATCNAEDQNRVKVKVEKHRGDTFLDALDGQRYKVAFEYDRIEGVGSITIARTMIGTKVVVGNGSTHEEAARAVREQVENILTDLKVKDEESRKEEIEREDRQKLVDFFKSLIDKDKEEERKHYYLEDKNGHQIPVITKFYFTKTGKVRIQALVQVTREGQVISTLGFSRLNAVRNLSDKVKGMVDRGEIDDFSGASLENGNGDTNSNSTHDEYTCNDCRTTFKKDYIYNLHRTQPCVV